MTIVKVLTVLLLQLFATGALGNCSVNVSGANFGTYLILSPTPTYSSGDIAINCLLGIPYNIKLDSGVNNPGNFFPRKLYNTFTSSTLAYNLYRDSFYSEVWGDGLSGTFTVSGVGIGSTELFRVYGQIPAGQSVASGAYSDSVTVLIEW